MAARVPESRACVYSTLRRRADPLPCAPQQPARLMPEPSRRRWSLVTWCPCSYESAALADVQIINPLGIGPEAGYWASWVWIGPLLRVDSDLRPPALVRPLLTIAALRHPALATQHLQPHRVRRSLIPDILRRLLE